MKAYMIATGPYLEMARITAPACEWATGLTVEVLSPADDPYRAKLSCIPDDEQYLFVDADVLFLRQWELPVVALDTFAAEPTNQYEKRIDLILQKRPADLTYWVNTGLFIASHKHRAVMQRARELFDTGISLLHEETVLNIALQELGTPRLFLHRVQTQRGYNVGEKAAHVCYMRGCDAKMAEIRRLLWWVAPSELKDHLADRGIELSPQPRAIPTTPRPGVNDLDDIVLKSAALAVRLR